VIDVQANLQQLRERLRQQAAESLSAADVQQLVGRLAADVLLQEPSALASYGMLVELLGEPVRIELRRPG